MRIHIKMANVYEINTTCILKTPRPVNTALYYQAIRRSQLNLWCNSFFHWHLNIFPCMSRTHVRIFKFLICKIEWTYHATLYSSIIRKHWRKKFSWKFFVLHATKSSNPFVQMEAIIVELDLRQRKVFLFLGLDLRQSYAKIVPCLSQ